MSKWMVKSVLFVSLGLTTWMISSCGTTPGTLTQEEIDEIVRKVSEMPDDPVKPYEIGVIETGMGTIKIEFFHEDAPLHCANFKKLANAGFYYGTTFHRVIPGFVIQGGDIMTRDEDPRNDGVGRDVYMVPAEIKRNHFRGAVAAARKPDAINPEKKSSMSQFYICVGEPSFLDGNYTVFGKVIDGMDVVDRIVAVERDKRDRPLENIYMKNVFITSQQ